MRMRHIWPLTLTDRRNVLTHRWRRSMLFSEFLIRPEVRQRYWLSPAAKSDSLDVSIALRGPFLSAAQPCRSTTIRAAAVSRDTVVCHMTLFPWQRVWQIYTVVEGIKEKHQECLFLRMKASIIWSRGFPRPALDRQGKTKILCIQENSCTYTRKILFLVQTQVQV